MCREEAKALSELKPSFDAKNVPMYAVLHEKDGAEQFQEFFDGTLLFDEDKKFFGPEQRRILIRGLLNPSTWKNIYQTYQKGISGNLKGDGTLLGGVFLIGPGEVGVLYEHREMTFGDHHKKDDILEALKKISAE